RAQCREMLSQPGWHTPEQLFQVLLNRYEDAIGVIRRARAPPRIRSALGMLSLVERREVAAIATEHLVAAVTRHRDGHVGTRELREQIRGKAGAVGIRLIKDPPDVEQELARYRLEDLVMMLGAEMPRDRPRRLVLALARPLKSDREGLE